MSAVWAIQNSWVLLLAALLSTVPLMQPCAGFRACVVTPMPEFQDTLPTPDRLLETREEDGAWGCVRLCARTPGCESLSHHPDTGHCVLYSQPLPDSSQVPPAPGYIFYVLCPESHESPSSNPYLSPDLNEQSLEAEASETETVATNRRYGERCMETAQCAYGYAECRLHICSCEAGYSFLNATGDCVTTCDTYGSTFYKVPDARVRLLNDVVLYPTSLVECLRSCTVADKFVCRSAEFFSAGRCQLSSATKLSHPLEWELVSMTDYYQRNCA